MIFSELLEAGIRNFIQHHNNNVHMPNATIAKHIGINAATLWHWRYSEIKRPNCKSVKRCAEFLKLDEEKTNQLLASAGCSYTANQPVSETKQQAPNADLSRASEAQIIEHGQPVTSVPISRVTDFFGRQQLLEQIFQSLHTPVIENIIVIGEKHCGKTSLLHYLKNIQYTDSLRSQQRQDWLTEDYFWAYVDFRAPNMHCVENVLQTILHSIHHDDIPCDMSNFRDLINEHCQDQPLVILLDNVDFGLRVESLDLLFWDCLRSLADGQKPIGFCVTSRESPVQLQKEAAALNKPSPFFNIFDSYLLEPLTTDEAWELFHYFSINEAAGQWILQHFKTYPRTLQCCCKLCLRYPDDWQQRCLADSDLQAHVRQHPS